MFGEIQCMSNMNKKHFNEVHRVRMELNLQESQQIDCSIKISDVMCIQQEKYSLLTSRLLSFSFLLILNHCELHLCLLEYKKEDIDVEIEKRNDDIVY